MEAETPGTDPVLERAWQSYAELDAAANKGTWWFYTLRKWIAWLGILTTLLAILIPRLFSQPPDTQPPFPQYASLGMGARVLLFVVPLLASGLAAFASRRYSHGSWLLYRAGAEELKKEIYLYRTVLPKDASRGEYLERRLGEILSNVERNLQAGSTPQAQTAPVPSGEAKPELKRAPPRRVKPGDDPGFHELSGEEYVSYRLKDQLDWHTNRLVQRRRERLVMTVLLLVVGALGALLAAFGGFLAIWVALTASVTAALFGWQELRKADQVIKNYSKVRLELGILYNHWQSLEPEERTPKEFETMVLGCERLLWTQNREYVRLTQDVLSQADLEKDAALINQVMQEAKESAQRAKETLLENVTEAKDEFLADTKESVDAMLEDVLETLRKEAGSQGAEEAG